MKTGIYSPSFYLYHDDLLLKINGKTVLGRTEGHIILEDDKLLSNIHCEFNPTLLSLSVKDLNSTNGVFVNKVKIDPGVDFQLKAGDLIRIGTHEYLIFDNESEAKKMLPKRERRKNPRPRTLYDAENLINFYSSTYFFRGIYFIAILGVVASFLLNLTIEVPVTKDLEFLKDIYAKDIIFNGVKMIFWVWAISFLHSFFMALYFNRNALRKTLGLVPYLLALFLTVDFENGPLWGIKSYLVQKESIQNLQARKKAILYLKDILSHEDQLKKAYKFTQKKISNDEHATILTADYKKLMTKIDREKSNLTQAKARN